MVWLLFTWVDRSGNETIKQGNIQLYCYNSEEGEKEWVEKEMEIGTKKRGNGGGGGGHLPL